MVYAYCFVSLGFLFGKCGLILTSLSAEAAAGPAEAAEAPGLTTATSTMVFAKAQVYLPWPRAKAHIARARHYRYAGDIQNVKAFGKSPEASTMQDPWQSLGPACAFGFLGGLISWTWCSTRRTRVQGSPIFTKASSDMLQDNTPSLNQSDIVDLKKITRQNIVRTVRRVALWSLSAAGCAFVIFPLLQTGGWEIVSGSRPFPLSDAAQSYAGNFLALISLLFSILAGNSYTSLYSQNESIFYALFSEVSEAKALMEQVALVCSGRPFYRRVLEYIQTYVERDLRRTDLPPAVLVACKPRDDPLESILYLTSVGVPSVVYDTVRSLRQKRGDRLGAVQRKLPPVQIALLYVLGTINLLGLLLFTTGLLPSEMMLGRMLFALAVGAEMMTMRVIHELWHPMGGAYNVDGVLVIMIRGLEDELQQRLQGRAFSETRLPSPPPKWQSTGQPNAPQVDADKVNPSG